MDANDHRPVFSAPLYEASVSEAAAPGTTILGLQCRDKDNSPSTSSSVYFSLHHAHAIATHGLFTIDSSSGDVIVAKPLDRLVQRGLIYPHALAFPTEVDDLFINLDLIY